MIKLFGSRSDDKNTQSTFVLETSAMTTLDRHAADSMPTNYKGNGNDSAQHLFKTEREKLFALVEQMRQAPSLEALFELVVLESRKRLQADRVLVYRFDSSTHGVVVVENRGREWTPTLEEKLPATCFGLDEAFQYLTWQIVELDNSRAVGELTPYQIQLLERFQVKASLTLPILVEQEVWGLLVVQQCSRPRQWEEMEINLLYHIVRELSLTMQSLEFQLRLRHQTDYAKTATQLAAKVMDKIRLSMDVDTVFQTTTHELRQLLKADRVGVYKFHPDWSGEFVYESVGEGWVPMVGPGVRTIWEDTHLQETKGGRYRNNETFAVDDIYKVGHSPCYVKILEEFQMMAYAIAPIFFGGELWGLLAAYQNSGPRHWSEVDVNCLFQVGAQFGVALKQAEYLQQVRAKTEQLAKTTEHQGTLMQLTRQIGQAILDRVPQLRDVNIILKMATQEVRHLLQADRVVVYRFNPDWSGEFIAESVVTGWTPLMEGQFDSSRWRESASCDDIQSLAGSGYRKVEGTYRQQNQGERYRAREGFVVDDIYEVNFPPYYRELLEQLEAKAYVIVPIFIGQKLWGLLAAYQNSGPRHWSESEISVMAQVVSQLGVALQQAEYLEQLRTQSQQLAQAAEREKAAAKVINKIRQSQDIDTIFKTTVQEVRKLLDVERLTIYKFRPDYFGDFVVESETGGWPKLVGSGWEDPYLNEHQGGRFRNNEPLVVDDVYNGGLTDCHVEALEYFGVKSCLVVAITQRQKLWGLLSAFQHSGPRHWEESDIQLLTQIGTQLGVALQQAEYLEQLRTQSQQLAQAAEREKAAAKVVNKIRQSQDIDTIFKTTAQEVRKLLGVERLTIYKFRPDYFGDFIVESETGGWPKLVGSSWEDPYLNEHQGGRFRNNEPLVVDDVYNGGLTDCHVEALEYFGVKSCLVVAITQGQKLWGLLSAFQHSGPRHWEESDIQLLTHIGTQLGVALQQAEYLEQLRSQSQQLAQAAEREKAAKEQLQHRAIQVLAAVLPTFQGDLTVRAPVTEDEVGTIADAYNNTLQSLRKLVTQVKTAATNVAQTSRSSESSINGLTTEAQYQFQELTQTLEQIQKMTNATQAVNANARQVEVVVQEANQTVQAGDATMNRTVDGILGIRETVAETGKKIKRLSESSQKISRVVNLISNFTGQTQILALNASIEATRAGDYGRGFAVVADEVRSLARQSATATTEIEKLVQEIQSETIEVAAAMETGIQQVVEGTNLVNETRQTLNEIMASTGQISKLVEGITQATQAQTQQSQSVTQTMADLAVIATKTSKGAVQISTSFKELLEMAQELQDSVGQFKVG